MRLEHVNMTVADLDRSVGFYRDLFGFEVRWEGTVNDGRNRAVHVGPESGYLALFEADGPGRAPIDYRAVGHNHFGFVVDDLDAMTARLEEMGVGRHLEADYEPGRRAYFFDPDGYEVELVEYPGAEEGTSPVAA